VRCFPMHSPPFFVFFDNSINSLWFPFPITKEFKLFPCLNDPIFCRLILLQIFGVERPFCCLPSVGGQFFLPGNFSCLQSTYTRLFSSFFFSTMNLFYTTTIFPPGWLVCFFPSVPFFFPLLRHIQLFLSSQQDD